jgi:hypothetical protein
MRLRNASFPWGPVRQSRPTRLRSLRSLRAPLAFPWGPVRPTRLRSLRSLRALFASAIVTFACAKSGTPDAGSPGADAEIRDADPIDVGTDAGLDAGLDGGFLVTPTPVEVCPRGEGTPLRGDVNFDGVLDVADPIALQNHLFRGGLAPPCRAAANFDGDDQLELDDSSRVTTHLLAGAVPYSAFSAAACAGSTAWPAGACGAIGFGFEGPARVTTGTFEIALAISTPTLVVQGWATSIRAAGCTITAASTDRTVAAEIWDSPPGRRHLGYSASIPVPGGAISFAIMSLHEDITLSAGPVPTPIMRLTIEATPPASGCAPCALSLADDLVWRGQPISTAIAVGGRAYVPEKITTTIQVCAP